ncbi:MAG: hypothetical protein KDH09_01410 [Chrysiogenetes bacterium]|nr:hypothetical protein [Chrysiogenetes bacterium]
MPIYFWRSDLALRVGIFVPIIIGVAVVIPLSVSANFWGEPIVERANMVFSQQKSLLIMVESLGCTPLVAIRQFGYRRSILSDIPNHSQLSWSLFAADILLWFILLPVSVFATIPLFAGVEPNVIPYSTLLNIVLIILILLLVVVIRRKVFQRIKILRSAEDWKASGLA